MKTIIVEPEGKESIQQAVDACHEAGGGRVVLRPGVRVSGTVRLKSRVTLHLEKGALLLGSAAMEDYPDNETCFTDAVGHKRGRALLYACNAENIAIEGEGTIDGRGGEFGEGTSGYGERPFLLRLAGCSGVRIEGVTLRQSAAWCLHLQECSDAAIRNIRIENRCNDNNDGIDIDSCSRVEIEDCMIDSGDDALCLKATTLKPCGNIRIRNCRVTTNWAGFKIGTESVGDFEDIEMSGCTFYDVKGCGIKVVPVDGGSVRNLYLHDLKLINCTGPVFFSAGRRLRRYFAEGRTMPGSIGKVTLERIYAEAVSAAGGTYQGRAWGNAKGCVVFSGLKELPIRDVRLKDCVFSMPGGISEHPVGDVPEMGEQYPEYHLFDVLPCWGMYLRHVQNVRTENCKFTVREQDCRPAFAKEDAEDV